MDNFKKRSEYIPYTPRYVFPEDSEEERIATLVEEYLRANYAGQRLGPEHGYRFCIPANERKAPTDLNGILSQISGVPIKEVGDRINVVFANPGSCNALQFKKLVAENMCQEERIITRIVEQIKQSAGFDDNQMDGSFLWDFVNDSVVILYSED